MYRGFGLIWTEGQFTGKKDVVKMIRLYKK